MLGPFGVQAFTMLRHICRQSEGGNEKVDAQAREVRAIKGKLASAIAAPGILKHTAAAVDVDEEEEWGIWQSTPPKAKCSFWPVPAARGLCLHTLCWL